MTPGEIIVHLVFPDVVKQGAMDLTDDEKKRAAKFHFKKDADHWIACRAALRRILATECGIAAIDLPLEITANGKPFLASPFDHLHFNLTHCRDVALVAVSASPVGIDIEATDRAADLLECETTFCHADEIASLPVDASARSAALLEIWVAKEALLKALGTGLLQPPEEVALTFQGDAASACCDRFSENPAPLRIKRLHHPLLAGHLAFVATGAEVSGIRFAGDGT